ncbi:MAG: PilW family protein [Pseudomonadota bacterium]
MRMFRPPRPQRGRTLIEVMIAMTIGLMITAGVITIYGANRQTYRASADVQRMQAAGQLALDRLAYQLRMAGYGQISSSDFWLVGNPSNFAGEALRVCSGGFDDPTAAAPNCNNVSTQADALAVSYLVGGAAATGSGEGRDCLGAAITAANSPIAPQLATRNRFYVASSGGVPTLMCVGNDGVAAPLVPNVEDLQIRLRVGDPFSRTERVVDPQSAAGWTAAQWGRVLGVELCVQVVSESAGLTADPQLGVDCRGNAYPSDGRLRRTFTQVVTLRNRVL